MFIALRRFTLLCTIMLERFMYHKKHDPSTYGAVTTMIAGASHLPEKWSCLILALQEQQHMLTQPLDTSQRAARHAVSYQVWGCH